LQAGDQTGSHASDKRQLNEPHESGHAQARCSITPVLTNNAKRFIASAARRGAAKHSPSMTLSNAENAFNVLKMTGFYGFYRVNIQPLI